MILFILILINTTDSSTIDTEVTTVDPIYEQAFAETRNLVKFPRRKSNLKFY